MTTHRFPIKLRGITYNTKVRCNQSGVSSIISQLELELELVPVFCVAFLFCNILYTPPFSACQSSSISQAQGPYYIIRALCLDIAVSAHETVR